LEPTSEEDNVSTEGSGSHSRRSSGGARDAADVGSHAAGRGSLDDTELSRLLKEWVEKAFPEDEDRVRETFVEVEFGRRLRSYQKSARSWRGAQT
jgi:hypothetical protein